MDARYIAIFVNTSETQGRGIFKGAASLVQALSEFRLRLYDLENIPTGQELERFDGIIAQIRSPELAALLSDYSKPVVNVSFTHGHLKLARVGHDEVKIGVLGVRHLVGMGYKRQVFIGDRRLPYSNGRRQGFITEANIQHLDYYECDIPSETDRLHWIKTEALTLIRSLEPPVAVFAQNDSTARLVGLACSEEGLAVPGSVGILGVDDDEIKVFDGPIPLSSVSTPIQGIGQKAASLLVDALNGGALPDKPVLFPPHGVVARMSTALLPLRDPVVGEAIRFIQNQVASPISVDAVAKAAHLGRRRLEQRFRLATGRTINQEIQHQRMARAKELLIRSDLNVAEIADKCGYGTPQWMASRFQKEMELSPTEYRKRFRVQG